MKKAILIAACLFFLRSLVAQPKSFELDNPDAIKLSKEKIRLLCSQKWFLENVQTINRGRIIAKNRYGGIEYHENGNFTFGLAEGKWELIDKRYIDHKLNNEDDQDKWNFGKIYAVTELTDTTLVLTKILTTTHDLKRIMYFKSEQVTRRFGYDNYTSYYKGKLDPNTLDSISNLSIEELFMGNYSLKDGFIILRTVDSVYQIKRKIQ